MFRSLPDPQTNTIYSGRIGIGLRNTGFQTNYTLLIINESEAPLTLRAEDFAIVSMRNQLPLRFQVFERTAVLQLISVAPKSTASFSMFINGVMGDIKATWNINGNLGTVEIPIYLPPPLPTPTAAPNPQCP